MIMTKLEQLRQIVATAFENAVEKEDIETLATINNAIDEVNNEEQSLIDKNAELIKSYKDLVKHTSFKDNKLPEDTVSGGNAPSFEEALQTFMSNNK